MKALLTLLLALAFAGSAAADGPRREWGGRDRGHGHYRGSNTRVSFTVGPYIYRDSGRYARRGFHGHRALGYGYGGYGGGWGYSGYYRPSPFYYGPAAYGYSIYGDGGYGRPSYAANGALWGALAGAVIGHNSGDLRHSSWRGAAYGSAAGYLLGSIAENNARRREAELAAQPVYAASTEVASPAPVSPAASAPSAPVTVSAERPSSSMSSANSLFGR